MANWGVVIGVDHYWEPSACLSGAVRDALAVRRWLLSDDGGNVPRQNIALLLAPRPGAQLEVTFTPATSDAIVKTLTRVIQRSEGEGERLYFYFSGHGLTAREGFADRPALIPADFEPDLTDKAVALDSITEYLSASRFLDQFVWIDACRNVPWAGEFRVRALPRPLPRDFTRPAPQQFVLHATSPGTKAAEVGSQGEEEGAFTSALLRGLAGEGSAKYYDEVDGRYVVRWNRLAEFVRQDVVARKVRLPNSDRIQVPRKSGEQGAGDRDSDPLFAFLPVDAVSPVTLELAIDPVEGATSTGLAVYCPGGGAPIEAVKTITPHPLSISLRPRTYFIRAEPVAGGYRSTRDSWPIELYAPAALTVRLSSGATDHVVRSGSQRSELHIENGRDTNHLDNKRITVRRSVLRGVDSLAQGILSIKSTDPAAIIEVRSGDDRIEATGRSAVRSELAPGAYRLRIWNAAHESFLELIDVRAGEEVAVAAGPPTSPETVLLTTVRSAIAELIKEASPEVALRFVGLPTLLAWTVGQLWMRRRDRVAAPRTLIAQPPSGDSECAICLVFADERPATPGLPTEADFLRISVRQRSGHNPSSEDGEALHRGVAGLHSCWLAVPSGAHVLSLRLPGRELKMPVYAASGHCVALVFHRVGNADVWVYQHWISSDATASLLECENMVRAQRVMLEGHYDVLSRLSPLAESSWSRLLGTLLDSYIGLREKGPLETEENATALAKAHPMLADARLLVALSQLSNGDLTQARQNAAAATEIGAPIFAGGTARLWRASEALTLDETTAAWLTAIVANRLPGVLWTLFSEPQETRAPVTL